MTEPQLPLIPKSALKSPKATKDFIKHIEIIGLLNHLHICVPEEFKQICNIYRVSLN